MLRDVSPKAQSKALRRARTLRANMTLPEVLLWRALRMRPSGLKFRRQHPSGPFILDFYCGDARLAIEVDGEVHGVGTRIADDGRRDAYFAGAGIATPRIAARDVLHDVDAVLSHVVTVARARLPLHHAAHGPPPRA